MNVRVFFMIIVSTMTIAASFEFAAAVSGYHSRLSSGVPLSPTKKSTLLDLKFALCRCATVLDPCFYGNYRMEVWDLMRKCFDRCPLQPQRCLVPYTDKQKEQENDYLHLKKNNFLCYLNYIPYNETYLREEIKAIKTKCRRYIKITHRSAEEPWWSPLLTTLLFMAIP